MGQDLLAVAGQQLLLGESRQHLCVRVRFDGPASCPLPEQGIGVRWHQDTGSIVFLHRGLLIEWQPGQTALQHGCSIDIKAANIKFRK
jgi:hypothetical protein